VKTMSKLDQRDAAILRLHLCLKSWATSSGRVQRLCATSNAADRQSTAAMSLRGVLRNLSSSGAIANQSGLCARG